LGRAEAPSMVSYRLCVGLQILKKSGKGPTKAVEPWMNKLLKLKKSKSLKLSFQDNCHIMSWVTFEGSPLLEPEYSYFLEKDVRK
jgi:hypothetical protein